MFPKSLLIACAFAGLSHALVDPTQWLMRPTREKKPDQGVNFDRWQAEGAVFIQIYLRMAGFYAIRVWSEEDMQLTNSAMFQFEKAYDYNSKRYRVDAHPVSPVEIGEEMHLGPLTILVQEVIII